MLLVSYVCPYSLEINISSSFFLHLWPGDSSKSRDLAWAACSVPRKADQATTNSEFWWMQGLGTECGLSLCFDAFLLSFWTNTVLWFIAMLCLCPPGQNPGISNGWSSCCSSKLRLGLRAAERRRQMPTSPCHRVGSPAMKSSDGGSGATGRPPGQPCPATSP